MGFPQEFPKSAVNTLLKYKEQDAGHFALAAYELVGYGLGNYFGDVKYFAALDFGTVAVIAEGAEAIEKVKAKAKELKGAGVPTFLIILQLLAEFGPVILKLVKNLRELINKA